MWGTEAAKTARGDDSQYHMKHPRGALNFFTENKSQASGIWCYTESDCRITVKKNFN